MERRNRKDSSHIYDKQLLSKLGRPNTPPRSATFDGTTGSPLSIRQTLRHSRPSLSFGDRSMSLSMESQIKVESPTGSRFVGSPRSGPVSPHLLSPGGKGVSEMDRRPSFGDSMGSESERYPRIATAYRRTNSSSSAGSLLSGALSNGNSVGSLSTNISSFGGLSGKSSVLGIEGMGPSISSSTSTSSNSNSNASARNSSYQSSSAQHRSHDNTAPPTSASSSSSYFSAYSHSQHKNKRRSFDQLDPTNSATGAKPISALGHGRLEDLHESERMDLYAADFPLDVDCDTGPMRHLNLDDHHHSSSVSISSPSFASNILRHQSSQGMKRKASSPQPELSHVDKAPLQQPGSVAAGSSSDLYSRHASSQQAAANKRASPMHEYHQQNSPYPSASNGGLQNGVYASAQGLMGGTTYPSQDKLSPGGMPQYSHDPNSPYNQSLEPGLQEVSSFNQSHSATDPRMVAALANKLSAENAAPQSPANALKMASGAHTCGCCPKKPKEFDTLEELL
jgi:hypothetical protein